MQHPTEKGLKVALVIDTPALGDTIAAIPTLRKISEAHDNKRITVFTSKPFLFEGHPLVDSAFTLDQLNEDEYFVHRTFMPLVGKTHNIAGEAIEFRYSNMDLRQFHAVSLGFTLKESEMEMDLYIESPRELPVKDYVIIHPTHTWPTRTWEQTKWQELIDRLNESGIPVVAVGRDSAETGHFNTQKPVMPINIKLGVNLLNDSDNDPAELRWMMNHRAKAVVTMDSGILHIAGTTDVNIIQLGSSIDNQLRAPYRKGSQDYKYQFVRGGCGIFCSSNQKYNIQAHGSIHGVPPQVNCLEGKPEFECHPTVDQVFDSVRSLYSNIDAQTLDMAGYFEQIKKTSIQPNSILEIGSRDAHHAEAIRRKYNADNVYIVEPNPIQTIKIKNEYPGFKLFEVAISDKEGPIDFYQIDTGNEDWDGISGTLERPDIYDNVNTNKITVQAITGKSLLSQIEGDIDMCKLDVEGLTWNVLNSFGDSITRIKSFHLETEENEIWQNQRLDFDVKELLESKGYIKMDQVEHDTKWGMQYDQVWVLKSEIKYDKLYITHCDEAYAPIANKMIETVKEFSNIPVVAYVINSDVQLPAADQTIRLDFDIRDGVQFIKVDGNNYVDRSSKKVFDIITKKPVVLKHALENLSEHVVYLDGDTIATHRIDDLFNYTNHIHPMMTQAGEEFMMMNGKGSPFLNQEGEDEIKDLSLTLEVPACELFGVDIENRNFYQAYVQTGYISAIKPNIPFINEWIEMCNHTEVVNNNLHYAPYHEETLVNVLLWKYKYRDRMPLVYVNANSTQRIDEEYAVNFNGSDVMRHGQWFFTPGKLEDIKVFHGEKRPEVVDEMIQHIKTKYAYMEHRIETFKEIENHNMNSDKKTLLYLAPHLSTGGMPQFLVKRVEVMLAAGEYNVHVLEYNQFSHTFLVQRDQIIDLLGKNFHTIAGLSTIDDAHRTRRMIEIIDEINPDLIHIEECPESFDSFNKLTEEGLNYLYDTNKPWKIIETCHNIWFQGENKIWNPDAYMFCTPYHVDHNFKDVVGSKWLATYPVVDLRPTDDEKLEAKLSLGFDPKKIHVLNVGLWTAGKNQAEGVNIAKIIESILPGKFQFHFVGNQASNFQDYWEPIMTDLPDNVTVWHERADVADFMMAADAFMFNSTWECNPLALREAISYGLVTFSRNLEQYLDMFTPYIIPFTNDLNDNAAILLDRLTGQEKIVGDFIQPQGEFERFTEDLLEAYRNIDVQERLRALSEVPRGQFSLEYQNGFRLQVGQLGPGEWRAEFWEGPELIYAANKLNAGHWYGPSRKWHTDWQVKVYHNGELYKELRWALKGKEVLVQFDSSSLGDTLAWMGQMEPFKELHGIKKLLVRTHKSWLFDQEWYSQKGIELIYDWQQTAEAQYNIGVYYDETETWKRNEHKYDWRHVTLSKIASDRLGIPYKERRPKLAPEYLTGPREPKKQIVIATQSTAQAKYWNNPTGWQALTNYWMAKDYLVLHASKEGTDIKGIIQLPEELVAVAKAIQEAELFIGISSGLSWFAWALGAKVVIISGFTDPYVEFEEAIYVNNHQVCHGCWGNHTFDRGDWNWCPVWKGTQRQFECTKTITAEAVIEKIESRLK